MFTELGIGPAVVQHRNGNDPQFLNTAWTLQILRSFVICACSCILAFPAEWAFGTPYLGWVIIFGSAATLFAGFNSTKLFVLDRNLRQQRRVMLDVIHALVSRGSMIAIACVWPSAAAIIGGSACAALVHMLLSHGALPGHQNRLEINRPALRQISTFGKWIFVGTIIAYFSQQTDKLLLANLVPIEFFGVYSIAMTLAKMPEEMATRVLGTVLFPLLAQAARADRPAYRTKIRAARRTVVPLAAFAVAGVSAVAPWFFQFLYDSRYHDACWITPLLAISVWFGYLFQLLNKALMSLGENKHAAISTLIDLIVTAACSVLLFLAFGALGFVVGTAIGAAAGYAALAVRAHRHHVVFLASDIGWTGALIGCSAISLLSYQLAVTGQWPTSLAIGLSLLPCFGFAAAAMNAIKGQLRAAIIAVARRTGALRDNSTQSGEA